MRILYIASYYKPAYRYGGPVTVITALCRQLVEMGTGVTVLTTNANGDQSLDVPLGQPLDVDGVTVHYYPIRRGFPRTFFYSPDLVRACTDIIKDHDLVILDTLFTHPTRPVARACLCMNKPYIMPLHGALLPWSLRQKSLKKYIYLCLLERYYLNHAAGLHCSDPDERDAVEHLRLKSSAFVVPYGLDFSHWQNLPPRGIFRRKLDISEKEHVLLMLGRLHRVKNPELAVEMLGLLERKDVHLVFVGPDEEGYQMQLLARASVLGCAGRIHFTGLLCGSSLLSVMADTDLFLMPSLSESFGMAAVEAMACGLPVLLSKYVPLGRWTEEAGAGRQVTCTPEAFAKACDEMLGNETALRESGERARELAFQRFDINKVTKRLFSQYQAILSDGQPLSDVQELQFIKPKSGNLQ